MMTAVSVILGVLGAVAVTLYVALVRAMKSASRDLGQPTPEEARIHFVYGGKRAEVDRLVEVEVETIPGKSDAELEKEDLNR